MKMDHPLIFDVQRFSLHDGPGIRTVAFFKGCPLACAWCHNPHSQRFEAETLFRRELCQGCGRCDEGCMHGARELVGREYSINELVRLLMDDRQLYDISGGGVTLSGGEPLAQDLGYLRELLTRLGRRGIHIAIDTCGHAPWASVEKLIPHVDLWLYDLKRLDEIDHKAHVGVGNECILDNLKRLSEAHAKIWLRVPVVPGVNASDVQMREMADFVGKHVNVVCVCLLPYHKLGQDRRPDARYFEEPSPERMAQIAEIWCDAGASDVRIGG